MKLFDLTGKKALVTGGGTGLGSGIAEGLLEAGAEVVLTGSSDKAEKKAGEFRAAGYPAHAVRGNLLYEEDTRRVFKEALDLLGGKIDILVNNAGIQRRRNSEDFLMSDFDDIMNVNLRSAFILCQLAGREMLKQGKGKIINILSMSIYFGGILIPAYTASKAGLAQMTKTLGNEWASKGINVNAIAPGYMATDMCMALKNDEERNRDILSRIPAGRWGEPSDMKGAVIFLASAASDYLSGAVIQVDGGYASR
ncbi:MAG: SDR family oxidoreductase [Acetivibrionales bacterium]